MTINTDMTKTALVDKAKALARKNTWLGIALGVVALILGAFIYVKGDKAHAEATFEIGGEILTAVFEDDKVTVVSATAPVTVVSGTEVSDTSINTFVDQQ